MEMILDGVKYTFNSPAEAVEFNRLRTNTTTEKRTYVKKIKKYENRTNVAWTKNEVFEVLELVKLKPDVIVKNASEARTRHTKQGVSVMANRLKCYLAGNKRAARDIGIKVKTWIMEHQAVNNR